MPPPADPTLSHRPADVAKRVARRTVSLWGRRHHRAELARLRGAPWDDPEAMDRERLANLRETVALASARSPFYRQLLGPVPIVPASLGDLRLLPTSRKSDIVASRLDRAVDRRLPVHRDVWRTSGTSGEPYVYKIDPWYGDRHAAQKAFVYLRAGVPRGARIVELLPGWILIRDDTFTYPTFRRTRVGYRRDDIVELVREIRPTLLYGNRSDLVRVANQVEASGRRLRVPFVCSSSEMLQPGDEALIARVLGARLLEVYGSSEAGNLAYRLPGEATWSVLEPRVVVEVLDEQGEPVGPGGTGEITVTTLTERVVPLVRYRTGDLASVAPGCTGAGRSGMRLAGIEGRMDDVVVDCHGLAVAFPIVAGNVVFASDTSARNLERWRMHQHADRRVEVSVQLRPGGDLRAVEELIRSHVESVLGPVGVTVVPVDEIETVPGRKFRSVTSDAVVTGLPAPEGLTSA